MTDIADISPIPQLTGSCLCARVRYEVKDQFRYALNCHCSQCRRATGAAFKPFAGIERDLFKIIEGADSLLIYGGDQAHDGHCSKCGSLLYSLVQQGSFVHVTLGSLIDPPSIRPSAHIFVGSKAPWYMITDDLPQYHELG
jgi:hypothetical protein